MKTLKNLKYFSLCLILFGIFANWAQNQYGLVICRFSLIALIAIFLTESIKNGKSRIKNIAFIIFGICSFLLPISFINEFNIGVPVTGIVLLLFWIFQIINPYINFSKINKINHDDKFAASESFMLFLFVTGFIFKQFHWPGASVLIIVACFGIFLLYIIKIIRLFFKEKQLPVVFKISHSVVLLLISAGYFTSFLFKLQHWPGTTFVLGIGFIFFVILIFLLIILKKPVFLSGIKTSPLKYIWNLKGNIRVLVIVVTLSYIHLLTILADIAPKFYTISEPPVIEKLIENKQDGKAIVYRLAYRDFMSKWIWNRELTD